MGAGVAIRREPARIFRYFKASPEIIRLTLMMYGRYPHRLRNVDDLRLERWIDATYETVRIWWIGTSISKKQRRRA